jgi:hypothetical protein
MHCDAVLLNGTCIVNESMLTGTDGQTVPLFRSGPQPGAREDILGVMREHLTGYVKLEKENIIS